MVNLLAGALLLVIAYHLLGLKGIVAVLAIQGIVSWILLLLEMIIDWAKSKTSKNIV